MNNEESEKAVILSGAKDLIMFVPFEIAANRSTVRRSFAPLRMTGILFTACLFNAR